MEILTVASNPVLPTHAQVITNIANRNGAPMHSPLVRLHDILAESNSADEVLAFLPLRKRAAGRA